MNITKKTMKTMTVVGAVLIFGIGSAFAVQACGSKNSSEVKVNNSMAGVNNTTLKDAQVTVAPTTDQSQTNTTQTESTVEETQTEAVDSYTQDTPAETEAQTEKEQQTEPQTEEQTEAATEAPALSEDQMNAAQAQNNASSYSSYINQVFNLINEERTAAGVSTVSYDGTLTLMACHRAVENANNNSMTVADGHHIRPNGQNASSICNYYGQYGSFGENLGRYQASPSEIVTGWHNSSAHYSCMTSTKYTRVGVGVAQDSQGNYYWAAIFMN